MISIILLLTLYLFQCNNVEGAGHHALAHRPNQPVQENALVKISEDKFDGDPNLDKKLVFFVHAFLDMRTNLYEYCMRDKVFFDLYRFNRQEEALAYLKLAKILKNNSSMFSGQLMPRALPLFREHYRINEVSQIQTNPFFKEQLINFYAMEYFISITMTKVTEEMLALFNKNKTKTYLNYLIKLLLTELKMYKNNRPVNFEHLKIEGFQAVIDDLEKHNNINLDKMWEKIKEIDLGYFEWAPEEHEFGTPEQLRIESPIIQSRQIANFMGGANHDASLPKTLELWNFTVFRISESRLRHHHAIRQPHWDFETEAEVMAKEHMSTTIINKLSLYSPEFRRISEPILKEHFRIHNRPYDIDRDFENLMRNVSFFFFSTLYDQLADALIKLTSKHPNEQILRDLLDHVVFEHHSAKMDLHNNLNFAQIPDNKNLIDTLLKQPNNVDIKEIWNEAKNLIIH